jgi:photosystem II stability/assembly factor-like uncharacterized protein
VKTKHFLRVVLGAALALTALTGCTEQSRVKVSASGRVPASAPPSTTESLSAAVRPEPSTSTVMSATVTTTRQTQTTISSVVTAARPARTTTSSTAKKMPEPETTTTTTLGPAVQCAPPTPFGTYVFSIATGDGQWGLAGGTRAIRRTSDGGTTWTSGCFPEGIGGSVRGLTIRGQRAWAVAGTNDQPTVIQSEDGGEHWLPAPFPARGFSPNDISFIDETHGWAIGSRPGTDPKYGPQYGGGALVFRTSDGGRTWETAADLPFEMVGGLRRVTFVDNTNGFVLGQTRTNDPLLLATADAGITWQTRTLPGGISEVRDLTFLDDQRGWMLGISHDSNRTNIGIVLRTTDGGSTWQEQWRMVGMTIWELDFTDTQNGFVIGGDPTGKSKLVATSDGGSTWSLSDVPGPALTTIDFSDATHGWVAGMMGACVRVTNDGGKTWASWQIAGTPGPCTV